MFNCNKIYPEVLIEEEPSTKVISISTLVRIKRGRYWYLIPVKQWIVPSGIFKKPDKQDLFLSFIKEVYKVQHLFIVPKKPLIGVFGTISWEKDKNQESEIERLKKWNNNSK